MSQIFDDSVNQLSIAIEEGARAGKGNISKFIEPAEGTLRRALSKRHHIIFGRRGSGKSSLLYKSADDLSKNGHPVALVDLEPFKGHQYPDIIISVLIATFKKYADWIMNEVPKEKGNRLWYTLFLKRKYSNNQSEKNDLQNKINKNISELIENLYLYSPISEAEVSNAYDFKSDYKSKQNKNGPDTKNNPNGKQIDLSL